MSRPSPTRQQVLAAISAAVVVLGGGGAAGGYYLREAPVGEAFPMERGAALEKWQATRIALDERDRQERAALIQAIDDSRTTNAAVRDVVIALTERMGAMAEGQKSIEARVRVLEFGGVRPASGKRP